MLSKFKSKLSSTEPDTPTPAPKVILTPSPVDAFDDLPKAPGKPFVPPYREGSVTDKRRSVLHEGITIQGNWSSDGIVEFGGTITGDLTADILVVTKTGQITGTIRADQVMIEGQVTGYIYAKTVNLKPTAQVKADISAPTISMDMGAQIEGQITMPPQRDML